MERASSISDEALMNGLSEGQMNCAAQLFERYHVRLYNFFLQLTGNRPLSEDLTQTVFERLIRYRESYVEGRSFRSWIYQIARNVRIDEANKNKRKRTLLQVAGTGLESAESASAPLEAREESQRLHRAMKRLNDDQREVLVLTRFQQLKYKEVAQFFMT